MLRQLAPLYKHLSCTYELNSRIQKGEIGVMHFGRLVRISAGELEKMGVFSPSMKESVEELLSR